MQPGDRGCKNLLAQFLAVTDFVLDNSQDTS